MPPHTIMPARLTRSPSADDVEMANYTAHIRSDVAGADRTDCPVTLKMFGGDFAEPDWDAGDAVIRWYAAHPEANVSAFYSTPAEFNRDIRGCSKTRWKLYAPPDNDFFPYWCGNFNIVFDPFLACFFAL